MPKLALFTLLLLIACSQPSPTLIITAQDGPTNRESFSIETNEDGTNMTARIGTNPEQPRESGQLELMMLNVSQGQAVYIKFPNGDLMFYDAAPRVKDYSYLYEGKTIQYVIASNVDRDHLGGIPDIFSKANIKHYIEGTPNFDHPCTTNTCAIVTESVLDEGIAGKTYTEAGDNGITAGSVKIEVLNPGREFVNDNDNSIVLLITYVNTTILLMGDCETKCENKLIEHHYPRDVDVLITGHHGSSTSSSDIFAKMTQPRTSLISVGKNNQYGHPSQEVLDRLEEYGRVYRTDIDGTIVVDTDGDKVVINGEKIR